MSPKKNLGRLGEELADRLLRKKGYKIIAKNFQTRFGEIDLVAVQGATLVFVEVKTRVSRRFGFPEEAVSLRKLRKIEKVASQFRLTREGLPSGERIDVVAIDISPEGEVLSQRLIENATG